MFSWLNRAIACASKKDCAHATTAEFAHQLVLIHRPDIRSVVGYQMAASMIFL